MRNTNKIYVIILMLVTQGLCANSNNKKDLDTKEVNQILSDLYDSIGDKRIECPTIELAKSEIFVAKYSPGSNKIVLEQKTIDLCSTFGEYKKDALAFIIGHELAHAFQGHLDHSDETSFLAYNKIYTSEKRSTVDVKLKESEADIFGSFGAYLAGYKVHKVFPGLINEIYSAYGLTDKILPQYPTKSFRKKTANAMISKLDSLVSIHDLATFLSLSGHYSEASACFDFVGKWYNSIDLKNNVGVNYLLEALDLGKLNMEKYYYPIEIDLETRLHKAKKTADTKDLKPGQKMLFELLLIDAEQAFIKCISMNPEYLPAYINMICTYGIGNKSQEALTFIKNNDVENKIYKNASPRERASYEIAKAICMIKAGKTEEGTNLLKALKSTSSENISHLALINLKSVNGKNLVLNSDANSGKANNIKKYKSTKPSKLSKIEIGRKKAVSLAFWSKGPAKYFNIIGDNEIIVVQSQRSFNIESSNQPSFINRTLKVFKNSNRSIIKFEDKKEEILILSD